MTHPLHWPLPLRALGYGTIQEGHLGFDVFASVMRAGLRQRGRPSLVLTFSGQGLVNPARNCPGLTWSPTFIRSAFLSFGVRLGREMEHQPSRFPFAQTITRFLAKTKNEGFRHACERI